MGWPERMGLFQRMSWPRWGDRRPWGSRSAWRLCMHTHARVQALEHTLSAWASWAAAPGAAVEALRPGGRGVFEAFALGYAAARAAAGADEEGDDLEEVAGIDDEEEATPAMSSPSLFLPCVLFFSSSCVSSFFSLLFSFSFALALALTLDCYPHRYH